MAIITLGGNPAETIGSLPNIGSKAVDFCLTATDMTDKSLKDYSGFKKLLNIFPVSIPGHVLLLSENSM